MPFRPGSPLDRVFGTKEQRMLPPDTATVLGPWGSPPTFKPKQSLEAYGDNVHLYGAVTKVAFEIAKTSFKLRKELVEGEEVEYVRRHQALDTLKRPQTTPYGQSALTSFDLKFITALHLLLPGEGFWVLQKRLKIGGGPRQVDIALPHLMYPRHDKDTGELKDYSYRASGPEVIIRPEDVVHFRLPDPLNLFRGHAPTQAIRYALDTHFEADLLNLSMIKNNAVPGGLLKPEQNIDKEKAAQLRAQWNQLYSGARNAGRLAVLPGKMDFQQLQLTPQELQYLEGKHTNRDEILSAYGVGLEILGKTESQTRANAETAVFVFMKFGVLPFLVKFADTLTNDYLPAFPGTDGLEFCFDDPVPENTEEKRLNATTLFGLGAVTPNEVRKMFGLEALNLPGMDAPYMDLGKMPVGAEPPEPDPEPDPLIDPNTQDKPARH